MLFCFSINTVLYAQEQNDDPLKQDFGDIANSLYISSGVGGKAGGNTGGIVGPLSSEFMGTNNGLMPGKELKGSKIVNGQSLEAKPGKKQSDFHTYIPKRQFEKMIDSKEWESMYNDSIKNNTETMIGATTWGLANSAVGQARFNAIMQAQEEISDHYIAEMAFIKQVEQNPYIRQGTIDAYFACIRDKMQGPSQTTEDNYNTKKLTWFEAQEACMGDKSSVNDNDASVKTSLFDYSKIRDQSDFSSQDKNICLSGYLFNQEQGNNNGMQNGIKELRESYQKLFGDIEFKIKEGNEQDDVLGVREINYTFYYPGSDNVKKSKCKIPDKTKSPSDLYLDVLVHRYNLLSRAVKKWCNDFKQGGQNGGNGDSPLNEYFESDEYKKLVEYYKVAGFNMNIQLIDNIYKIAKETIKNEDGKINCDEAFVELSKADALKFREDSQGGVGNDEGNNSQSRLYKSILYNIANKVSEITVMKLYFTTYSYIQNLTTGVFGAQSEIYKIANKQVNQIFNAAVGVEIGGASNKMIENLAYLSNVNFATNQLLNAQTEGMISLRRDGQNSDGRDEELVK